MVRCVLILIKFVNLAGFCFVCFTVIAINAGIDAESDIIQLIVTWALSTTAQIVGTANKQAGGAGANSSANIATVAKLRGVVVTL